MNKHQELAIQALQNMKGDDSYRAQLAFRGQNLDEPHGQSEKTRRQILNEYLEHEAKVSEAILWVKESTHP